MVYKISLRNRIRYKISSIVYFLKNNIVFDTIYYRIWNFLDFHGYNPKKNYKILKIKYRERFENLYFECDIGWYDLLDSLLYNIREYPEIEVAQIKEKFGTLRFYIWGGNDEIVL